MGTDGVTLGDLPARWREHPMFLGDRGRWTWLGVEGDDDAVLVAVERAGRRTILGLGDPAAVTARVERWARDRAEGVGWMSLARGAQPSSRALDALGLAPFSTWDWLWTRTRPAAPAARPGACDDGLAVARLTSADEDALKALLVAANPDTSADVTDHRPPGWWGLRAGERLVGAGGARTRLGDPDRADLSWHLTGLGIHPDARRAGYGTVLASAMTDAAFTAGADWVSLGVYAENLAAQRLYATLGFEVGAAFTSYGPVGAQRPPS